MNADDFTVVALSSWTYKLIALNWALHMKRLNIENYLVYCLDEHTYKFLKENDIRCDTLYVAKDMKKEVIELSRRNIITNYWLPSLRETKKAFAFEAKLILYKRALEIHKNIIYSDIDAVWIKNPFPLILKDLESYDILISQEQRSNLTYPWSEYKKILGFMLCAGWLAFKNSQGTQDFMNGIYSHYIDQREKVKTNENIDDQKIINTFILNNIHQVELLENIEYSVTSQNTKIKIMNSKIIDRSRTCENYVYIYHPYLDYPLSPKALLLNKKIWVAPWLVTLRNINFIGSFILLCIHLPFVGNKLQKYTPEIEATYNRFALAVHRRLSSLLSHINKLFAK